MTSTKIFNEKLTGFQPGFQNVFRKVIDLRIRIQFCDVTVRSMSNHMNKTPQDGSPWSSVDQSADPSAFIRFLDKLRADDSVRAWKLQSYKYLEVKNGSHILDVGCGTGEDVRALAQHVGNTGRVVGVDSSEVMIVEAQKRANGLNLPVEFFVGNAHQLDFTESFDGCRADLTFQNLDNPQQALAELVRVARPGARIVLSEPDWETFIINADD